MRKKAILSFALVAGAAVAVRHKVGSSLETWASAADPTEGRPLDGPIGDAVEVSSADGAVLRGIRAGEGPRVLLIHGWTGTIGHYAPVARRLVDAGFEVISVDQRGHGRSSVGDLGFTEEALAADVKAWVEGLDLDGAVLSGHSMGGLAIQSFAVHHPDVAARVKAFVLVSTLATPEADERERAVGRRALATTIPRRLIGGRKYGVVAMRNVVGRTPTLSLLQAARATYLATAPESILGAYEMMLAIDLRSRLATISVPTAFIVGTDDNLTSQESNEELARLIPGASIEIVDGAGHMLPWEAPDRVTDLIVQAHKPTS